MKSRSVSLTGATGFVGWHLAEAFQRDGWHVRAIVRPGNRKPLPAGTEMVESPLTTEGLTRAVSGADLFVHCAGIIRAPHEAVFRTVNVDGTRAAVAAANRAKARLMFVSSLAAGGPGTPDRPRRESDPSAPVNAYGRSKVAAEAIVKTECETAWTIVRPCSVYGPRDRAFLPLFQMSKRGILLSPTDPAMAFSFVDVGDLVAAMVLAGQSDRAIGETFFLAHPSGHTSAEVIGAMARAFGRRGRARRLPMWLLRGAAALGDLTWKVGWELPIDRSRFSELIAPGFVCSVDRLRERLGFSASTDIAEGFERTARWYEREGWL